MAGGRPSTYTEEMGNLICDKLTEGMSLRKLCLLDEFPTASTVYVWLDRFPEFVIEAFDLHLFTEHWRLPKQRKNVILPVRQAFGITLLPRFPNTSRSVFGMARPRGLAIHLLV